MEEMKQMVSIIIPVYNVEKFIIQTLDCVRKQTFTNWEVILVEDGSQDKSVELIEKYCSRHPEYKIHLIRLPQNVGAAAARNKGVMEARGRFIAYLDADDIWAPDKLEKQLHFMEELEVAFSFTGYEFAEEDGRRTGKIVRIPTFLNYKEALKNTTIFTTTVMFDLDKIEKEQLMMPSIKSEDTALWWKILRNGYTAYGLDENLAKYRRAGKTLSSNKVEAVRRIWNLYRRAEGMSIVSSLYHICFWAVRAVKRRM